MKELAQQFGVHRTTVAGCLRKLGIPLRRQGLSPTELDQAAALYRQGWSLVRLGEKLGCDAETVRQRFKQVGVVRRGPHER
jgi:lambda repressor-like predicted transcriptional regulator